MTNQPGTGRPGTGVLTPDAPDAALGAPARLEPDAIGAAQDTVIGMAYAAPTLSLGLTLAALVAASAYAVGPTILLTAIPMLIIANSYRRLNLWQANCGASFEWVGRAINPYLGFLTGWLMVAGTFTGAISGVVVLGPSILAVFGGSATAKWPNIIISTMVIVAMLVIAIVGIRLTARTQVAVAVIEYIILIGFSIWGLVVVLGHHPGTFPITREWFNVTGIGGKGSLVAGFLIAVFMYTGWDATVYVNEEVKHRRSNPGKAAVLAVSLVTVIFIVGSTGLAGVVSPDRLQNNAASALVYIASALGGGGWAKVMAFALALSVVACSNIAIVIIARMVYGMASHRVLPPFLANVNRRYATPAIASIVIGVSLIVVTWVYLLFDSIANVFIQLIDVTGLLYAAFYILTALAAVTYYRRRIFSNVWDAVLIGVLPIGACVFLGWILIKSLMAAPGSQILSIVGIVGVGIVLMIVARLVLRSPFFQIKRESAPRDLGVADTGRASAGVPGSRAGA
jgi:amino acid transporter